MFGPGRGTLFAPNRPLKDRDAMSDEPSGLPCLAPQKEWEVSQPAELAKVLKALEAIQKDFNGSQIGGKEV